MQDIFNKCWALYEVLHDNDSAHEPNTIILRKLRFNKVGISNLRFGIQI